MGDIVADEEEDLPLVLRDFVSLLSVSQSLMIIFTKIFQHINIR